MKKIVLSAMLLAMTLTAGAVRPIHKLFPVQQNDGTTVMLYKNGDGHLAFYTTEDNKVVVRDASGRLCYGVLNANNELVASNVTVHNLAERTADETAYVSTISLKPTDTALLPLLSNENTLVRKQLVKNAGRASTSDGLGKYGTNSGGAVPSNGAVTIPVIMVAYSDKDFQSDHTIAKMNRYFNEEGYHEDNMYEVGSVKDYFIASSDGHFVPTFDIVAKVTLPHPYSYYGANQNSGSNRGQGDVRAYRMVADAVAAAVQQGVDFSKYYVDGAVPNVTILYAGLGEATGGDENTIWPHELDLNMFNNTMSGYRFGSYYVGNEMYSSNTIMGIGVLCHEFSHALGLPDFYSTNYSYDNDAPFGYWSIMDNGEYYANSYAPVAYNAYERSFMGWLNIPELKDAESVTLENPTKTDAACAVMFRNPSNSNEYFILENRQPDTFYPSAMGSGVLVTRIAYNSSDWTANILNNTQSRKRAMVVTANGARLGYGIGSSSLGNENNLYGNGENYAETLPLYNGTDLTSAPFYKIIKHEDGSITLSFKDKTLSPEIESNGKVFEKVTDLSQLASGDSVIFVNGDEQVAIGNENQNTFRAAANVGIDGNDANGNNDVMVFRAMRSNSGSWGFRNGTTYLSSSSNGLALQNGTTYALANLTINNGNASVMFTRQNRYLAYATPQTYFTTYTSDPGNIQIYRLTDKKPTTGISSVSVDSEKSGDNHVFNLAGQQVGKSYKGIVIKNGKKYIQK